MPPLSFTGLHRYGFSAATASQKSRLEKQNRYPSGGEAFSDLLPGLKQPGQIERFAPVLNQPSQDALYIRLDDEDEARFDAELVREALNNRYPEALVQYRAVRQADLFAKPSGTTAATQPQAYPNKVIPLFSRPRPPQHE